MSLSCHELVVAFDDVRALNGASLDVPEGSVTAVMGPSGCGKSTLLRSIAGLQRTDSGTVTWRGVDLDGVPPHRRRFGFMFQDYALFPHLTVRGNVGFGLRMQDAHASAMQRRIDEVLGMVGLTSFADRTIDDLSGGEQQRVALARTLAPGPELLLLDEPLGALDRALRIRLLAEMRTLFVDLGLTVVYVTHDADEAFTIADRLAVMEAGQIIQVGTPETLWTNPASGLVATLVGHPNVLDTTGADELGIGVPADAEAVIVPPGQITLRTADRTDGVVVESRFAADRYTVTVTVGSATLLVATDRTWPRGTRVAVDIGEVTSVGRSHPA